LPLATLSSALQEAAQIDKTIKGLRAKKHIGDAWDGILQLGLRIAGSAA
jgi:DNA polymerase-3 subunit delta